jgi:hypothetical protein
MQFSPVLYYFATLISSTLFADSQSVFLLSVSSDQIKENEVGGTCDMHGKRQENVHGLERTGKCARLWWESPRERDHSENRGVDGRMG